MLQGSESGLALPELMPPGTAEAEVKEPLYAHGELASVRVLGARPLLSACLSSANLDQQACCLLLSISYARR